MGGRVWQVQKELEELKGRSQGSSEVQTSLTHIQQVIKHLRVVSQLFDVLGTFFHEHRCRNSYLQLLKVQYIPDWRFKNRKSLHEDCMKSPLFSSLSCCSGKSLQSDGSITSFE